MNTYYFTYVSSKSSKKEEYPNIQPMMVAAHLHQPPVDGVDGVLLLGLLALALAPAVLGPLGPPRPHDGGEQGGGRGGQQDRPLQRRVRVQKNVLSNSFTIFSLNI